MSDPLLDQLAARRAEQKAASEKAEALKQAKQDAGRNYANPERRDEAQRRFTELRSPAVPAARPTSPPPSVSGKPVEFYAWKEGGVGKIKILTQGEFTAI